MSTLALDNNPPDQAAGKSILTLLSAVVIVLWGGLGALSARNMSCIETLNAAGILFATLAGLVFWRNTASAAGSPAARLWTVALFFFGVLTISPAFQRATTLRDVRDWDRLSQISAFAPLLLMALLWILARATRSAAVSPAPRPASIASQLEALIDTPAIRLQLIPLALLLAAAGLGLSGQPLRAILPRGVLLAALLLLALRPLLQLAATPAGVGALRAALLLAMAASALSGAGRFMDMRGKVAAGNALLAQDKPEDAQKIHAEAAALNEILQSKSTRLEVETEWALFYERKEQFESSLVHWRRIADERGQDPTEMLPIRRVLCKMGDSLTAWRRLIYQGFPSIADPEIAPGILALGDNPGGDLRGKLLAALLAWEQNAPEAERRRRLEEVRKVLPNEPTSNNLLKRMGVAVPDAPLWLPAELIAGKKLTTTSLLGSIEELGEVDTLVVLDEGHWELALNARGTPLHEEWPVIRLEFNGQVIARTQVTHDDNRDVPFTFDVHCGDIYRVKVILENQQEILDQGHITRRGLVINGMTFRRAKE